MPEAAVKVVDPPVKVTLEPCVIIAVGRGLTVTFKYWGAFCKNWNKPKYGPQPVYVVAEVIFEPTLKASGTILTLPTVEFVDT